MYILVHNIIYSQYVFLIPKSHQNQINEYASRLNMILIKKVSVIVSKFQESNLKYTMYMIVHNNISNKYDYLTPNKSNALSSDTQEGQTGFCHKKFLFLIPSRSRKAVQDFDKKKFRGAFDPKSEHKIKNKLFILWYIT